MLTVTRKIGQNRGRPRVWLEGSVLVEAGLAPADYYKLSIEADRLNLSYTGTQKEKGYRKVSGKLDKPIIDILGKALEQAFGADNMPATVNVQILSKGEIEITRGE